MSVLHSAANSFRFLTVHMKRQALHSTALRAGVIQNVRDAYDGSMKATEEGKAKKIFEKQMKYFCSPIAITPNVFLNLLRETKEAAGLGGVKQHFPWVQNNPALGEFKEQENIIRALNPTEMEDAFSIKISRQRQIAHSISVSFSSVQALLDQLMQLRRVQKWVSKRQKLELQLPKDSIELERMISASGGLKGGRAHKNWPNPGIRQKERIGKWRW